MGDQHFLSLIVLLLLLCAVTSAQNQCAEIDFNRTVFNEFRECNQRQLPALAIKDYTVNIIPKYRPTSRYFLGTNFNEFSCIESSAKFSLNPDSYIKAPVYFKSASDAFIEVLVYDMDQNLPVYSWRKNNAKGEWSMAHIDIKSKIPNAQIVIQTFMNAQSFVAVEYIHILNKATYNSDCMNMDIPVANIKPFLEQGNVQPTKPPGQQGPPQGQQPPQQGQQHPQQGPQGGQPTKPPGQQSPQQGSQGGQIQPTKPPNQQGPPQQGQSPRPIPTPPHNNANANNNANNIYLHESLVAILVLSTLSVASIILIGLYYCFVGSRQKSTHHCTK